MCLKHSPNLEYVENVQSWNILECEYELRHILTIDQTMVAGAAVFHNRIRLKECHTNTRKTHLRSYHCKEMYSNRAQWSLYMTFGFNKIITISA